MKFKIEYFTKVTFVSVIIIASDLIGQNDTTRTRFRRLYNRRRQDTMAEEIVEMEMETTTSTTEKDVVIMEMNSSSSSSNSNSSGMMEFSNSNVVAEESRDTRGIRGFLPGFNLGGGGGGGRGLFRGLKGGSGGGSGGGLFGGLGLGGKGQSGGGSTSTSNTGSNNFPEFPSGGNTNSGNIAGHHETGGWGQGSGSSSSSNGSGGKELFSSFPGAGLFRNPFGGGGKGGRGRRPFGLLSRLNQDQPCAAGLSSLPILSRLPFIPQKRFPSFIPSGVNTCDATCDSGPGGGVWRRVPPTKEEQKQIGEVDDNSCTYNWRDSLMGLPFLLFRCQCKKKCPPKRVRIGGIFSSQCENVSGMKSRCKCPYGQESYKCTITILPISVPFIQRKKPYYCTCCNDNQMGSPLGTGGYGYDPSPSQSPIPEPVITEAQEVQVEPMSTVELLGGYGYGGGNSATDSNQGSGASSSNIVQKELPKGMPLGSEHYYEHL